VCKELKIQLVFTDVAERTDFPIYINKFTETLTERTTPLTLEHIESLRNISRFDVKLYCEDFDLWTLLKEVEDVEDIFVTISAIECCCAFAYADPRAAQFLADCLCKGALVAAEALKAIVFVAKNADARSSLQDSVPALYKLVAEKMEYGLTFGLAEILIFIAEKSLRPEFTWGVIENTLLAIAAILKGNSPLDMEECIPERLDFLRTLLDYPRVTLQIGALAVLTEIAYVFQCFHGNIKGIVDMNL
jgi:hypothetical protein